MSRRGITARFVPDCQPASEDSCPCRGQVLLISTAADAIGDQVYRVPPQVAARHAGDPATRSALTKEAGQRLAQRVAGDAIALARSSGHGDSVSDGTKAAVASALQVLKDGGFVEGYQVSWGSRRIDPTLRALDADPADAAASDSSADANVFQVKGQLRMICQ